MNFSRTDSIQGLRSRFQVGDFYNVVDIARKGKFGEEYKEEVEFIMFRSLISLGKADEVKNTLNSSTDALPHLLTSRLLALFYLSKNSNEERNTIIEQFTKAKLNPKYNQSLTFHLGEASVFINEGKYEEALNSLDQVENNLEVFEIYLKF